MQRFVHTVGQFDRTFFSIIFLSSAFNSIFSTLPRSKLPAARQGFSATKTEPRACGILPSNSDKNVSYIGIFIGIHFKTVIVAIITGIYMLACSVSDKLHFELLRHEKIEFVTWKLPVFFLRLTILELSLATCHTDIAFFETPARLAFTLDITVVFKSYFAVCCIHLCLDASRS